MNSPNTGGGRNLEFKKPIKWNIYLINKVEKKIKPYRFIKLRMEKQL